MADIDIERKNNSGSNKNNNTKWWVLLVLVIIGIIVLWFAFSDTTNVESENGPDPEDHPRIEEPISSAAVPVLPFFEAGDRRELTYQLSESKIQDYG